EQLPALLNADFGEPIAEFAQNMAPISKDVAVLRNHASVPIESFRGPWVVGPCGEYRSERFCRSSRARGSLLPAKGAGCRSCPGPAGRPPLDSSWRKECRWESRRALGRPVRSGPSG